MDSTVDFTEPVDFLITDALTGDVIEFDYATGGAVLERSDTVKPSCTSLFFPGCSFINYAMPLVAETYEALREYGAADGISVLCCGKILSYEPDGEKVRASFEQQLREHVAAAGIKRVVCACPNCLKAMKDAFAVNENTKDIEVVALPQVIAELGYKLDAAKVAKLLKGADEADEADEVDEADEANEADVLLCTHDSCPDREYGVFADGLRALMPDGLWADPAHCRSRSVCCGSLPRAAGKVEQADKCAGICGSEAEDVGADAIVTVCMSCAFQLNMAQRHVPCVHVLELLFNRLIDWHGVGQWMKLRFLFDETLGVIDKSTGRDFAGLGAAEQDIAAARDVAFNDADVADLGE